MEKILPKNVQVVVIGGGIAGCSVAYHLGKLGIKDSILLERKSIGCGTSYQAAGMIREQQSSEGLTWLSKQTNKIFAGITEETGVDINYRRVGSLYVTNCDDRVDEFRSSYSA